MSATTIVSAVSAVSSVFPWQSTSETPYEDARFLHQYSQSSVCNLAHHLAAVRVAKALNRPSAVISVLESFIAEDAERLKLRVMTYWAKFSREDADEMAVRS
jgi:hypothetical protein